MNGIDSFLKRKVAGVKVVYIAAIGAVILAIIAWNIYKRDQVGQKAGESLSDGIDAAMDYPDIDAIDRDAQAAVTNDLASDFVGELSNDEWAQKAINYIVQNNRANTLTAQLAIQKYLNGSDLSYSESLLVDYAIGGVGAPPVLPNIGKLPLPPSTTPQTPTVPTKPTNTTGKTTSGTTIVNLSSSQIRNMQSDFNKVFPAYRNSVSVNKGKLLDVNGKYDAQTTAWVKEFQKRTGLPITGKMDKVTYATLQRYHVTF